MTVPMISGNEYVLIQVPVDATPRYWEGWAEPWGDELVEDDFGTVRRTIRTVRSGRDGRSDSQFIKDRLASGLHSAKVVGVVTITVTLAEG